MLTMNSVQGGIVSLNQTTEGQNIRNQQPKQSWKTYKIDYPAVSHMKCHSMAKPCLQRAFAEDPPSMAAVKARFY